MDAVRKLIDESLIAPPHIAARYRAVYWEPLPGTGERIVALICIEPLSQHSFELLPGTYPVIQPERLRAIFGRKRGDAASGVLKECAEFMSMRQGQGTRIEDVSPLFSGFALGPIFSARAYGVEQLLDAAVRTVTAFGSAEDLVSEAESHRSIQSRRTAEFLRELRRVFSVADESRAKRFNVCLRREQEAPEVWVDYASGSRIVQAVSVPNSKKQAPPAELELKAKVLDLEVVRDEFKGNNFMPTLLLNVRALEEPPDEVALAVARQAQQKIQQYARWAGLQLIEVSTPEAAAKVLEAL